MTKEKERIGYFDLMKGVCIILVVIAHCYDALGVKVENERVWSMLEHLRMPLYFFLSGMFFKEYDSAVTFVVKKFNRLIVPFLFFAVVSVIPLIVVGDVPLTVGGVKGHITWMLKYAGYLWFLRTLFVANILYYICNKVLSGCREHIKVIVLCVIVAMGWIVNSYLPQDDVWRRDYSALVSVVTSMMVFPFFYVASQMKQVLANIVDIAKWKTSVMGVLMLAISAMSAHGGVYLMYAKVDIGVIGFYVASFSAIFAVMSACVLMRKVLSRGYVNYVGRYSIIVYLTHMPIITGLVKGGLVDNLYVLEVVVLALMPVMVWVMKRVVPALVAQRDIIKCEKGKCRVNAEAFSLKNR